MERLLEIRNIIINNPTRNYGIETKNKETGQIGWASFHTNGEDKIKVFEGNPDGSDDKSYAYEEFIEKYEYTLIKEGSE